jgi:hypothetical protein
LFRSLSAPTAESNSDFALVVTAKSTFDKTLVMTKGVEMNPILKCGLIVWFALLVGCGKSAPNTTLLSGEIKTDQGVACAGAFIVFHPQEKERLNDPKPLAIADTEGKFVVRTHGEADGAEPGEYAITVVWPQTAGRNGAKQMSLSDEGSQVGSGPDQLNNVYGDPKTTKLKVTVKKESNEPLLLTVGQAE